MVARRKNFKKPAVSIDLTGRENSFTVTQAEFDNYGGRWYLVDTNNNNWAKAGAGAVFNVESPMLDVSIRDSYPNGGADVSGTSVPIDAELQFQIVTNMYTVLADTTLRSPLYNKTGSGGQSDGFLDIVIR